MTDLTFVSDEL